MSGVTVATMIASRSLAAIPRCARALFAASAARSLVRNTFVDNMAFADADAAHDPFVVGIDHFFQVGVGEKTWRNVGAKSADLNAL